ncbi:hypothetical protein C8R46DRAFT_1035999 [Mycena filopes]|nr:hypothetical protein C8R46DRAFT_1035999 [Mycena filopes]
MLQWRHEPSRIHPLSCDGGGTPQFQCDSAARGFPDRFLFGRGELNPLLLQDFKDIHIVCSDAAPEQNTRTLVCAAVQARTLPGLLETRRKKMLCQLWYHSDAIAICSAATSLNYNWFNFDSKTSKSDHHSSMVWSHVQRGYQIDRDNVLRLTAGLGSYSTLFWEESADLDLDKSREADLDSRGEADPMRIGSQLHRVLYFAPHPYAMSPFDLGNGWSADCAASMSIQSLQTHANGKPRFSASTSTASSALGRRPRPHRANLPPPAYAYPFLLEQLDARVGAFPASPSRRTHPRSGERAFLPSSISSRSTSTPKGLRDVGCLEGRFGGKTQEASYKQMDDVSQQRTMIRSTPAHPMTRNGTEARELARRSSSIKYVWGAPSVYVEGVSAALRRRGGGARRKVVEGGGVRRLGIYDRHWGRTVARQPTRGQRAGPRIW